MLYPGDYRFKDFVESLDECIEQAYNGSSGNKDEFKKLFLENFYKFNAGLNLYIPKGPILDSTNTARNRLIREEFNGVNHSRLAIKYGVSLQYIYKIVKGKQPYEID